MEWVSLVVSLGYFFLCLLTICQLFRIFLFGHKIQSFASSFLFLCLLWSFIRCIYFIFDIFNAELNDRDNLLFFWIPSVLQFSTFSLVLVYYDKKLHDLNWESKCYVYFFYYIANTLLFATLLISLIYYCLDGSCRTNKDAVLTEHYIFFAMYYLVLVCLYGIYTRLLWKYHRLYVYSTENETTIFKPTMQHNNYFSVTFFYHFAAFVISKRSQHISPNWLFFLLLFYMVLLFLFF